MIEVNYIAILVCAIIAMVLGFIWYGPLFGKQWMKIIKVTPEDMKARQQTQSSMGLLYATQFILSFIQAYVLAYYIAGWREASGVEHSLWIWLAFIMPMIAQGSMWNNDSRKTAWSRFLIQASYQLVLFIVFGLVLGSWR